MLSPYDFDFDELPSLAPAFAASIKPGPPPVTISAPLSANSLANIYTSLYSFVSGFILAEPNILTL